MQRLLLLVLAAFIAQTSEYLPIGLLPQIAGNLKVAPAQAGFLVTGYAWIAALTAVPFTLATQRLPRRTVFVGLLGIIALANALTTFANSYTMLASSRVLAALTHGVFWSMIAPYAVRVAPEMPAGRATAWALSGISLALVVGVPCSTMIGHWLGWRMAFATSAVLGGLTGVLSFRLLLPEGNSASSAAKQRLPGKSAALYTVAIVTLLIVASHFTGYTYVVPILTGIAYIPEERHALFLLSFGLAGAVGTWLAGRLTINPASLSLIAAIGVIASQAAMLVSRRSEIGILLEMAWWGASIAMLIVGLQSWVIAIMPERAEAASSLYVAAFNLGIGGGALAGGIALAHGGIDAVLKTSSLLGSSALLGFLISRRRRTNYPPCKSP
ncbi:MFS transporter [Xanthomonas hyacinthi]|uniref:MFS transporter n=1 Tax=Xanthomonas hyacinthi TaxID=56455 RepID=A0A2S7EXM5_9XANT|nr:MFS transporter [Xanthomonas hyacinthi]PPU97849.1 MFS transporter [Xanthomonas hyacinthi]QGY76630.1 MFS transporter [Xanthomonas hyacinthi]